MPELVGRSDTIEAIAEVLDEVEGGRSASLLVEGVAGVGKTTVLDHVARVAAERDWTVARAAGTEFEQEMAFTGLGSIVGPHLDVVDSLDARYAQALRAALGLDEGSTPQLAVSVALLTFLATMAERSPLLVVVDDLHWLDQASVSALHFAVHRLDADQVLVLFASRPESLPPSARAFRSLPLDDLADDEVLGLLAPLGVHADVARRCSDAVGGNPLGLLELARRLSQDQRLGRAPLPDPLPLATRLADAFQPLLDALSTPTRQALEVAAVAGTSDLTVIHRSLDALDLDRSELGVAEAAGLVTLGATGLTWIHPLARATVLHNTTRDDRRRAHRVIADMLDQAHDADQIAWHLASAATGPDEALAGRLEAVGEAARRRGALAAAAQAFLSASQLSEDGDRRTDRLRLRGQALWAGGASGPSSEVMHQALQLADGDHARAMVVVTLGEAETWSRGVTPAVDLFERSAAAISPSDPALAAHLYVRAAGTLIVAGQVDRALTTAALAEEAAARTGQAAEMFAAGTVLAIGRLLSGEPGAIEALAPITDLTLALLPGGEGGIEMAAQLAGFGACVTEQWDQAETLLGGVIDIGEQLGLLGVMAIATVLRADARFRSGRSSEAFADLVNVESLIQATDEETALDFVRGYLARVEGQRGLEDDCRRHAAAAIDTAGRLGLGSTVLMARHGLAVLELGLGHPDRAIEHLDRIAVDTRDWGIREPGALWWQADHVETLVVRRRFGEAHEKAEQLAETATRTDRRFAPAAAAWCRAIVGAPEETDAREAAWGEALDGMAAIDAEFERGRILLARGRDRLRRGSEADGRRDVAESRTIFGRLGAQPWTEQARQSLGGGPRDGRPTLAESLTPAELRVALCVGGGASNRQAADELFLSVKTVDYHLQNIYPKLAIRSRAQLASVVAAETAVAPG